MTELKPGTVFLLRTEAGRAAVVKRSDEPWLEASAAALGRLACVRTVPARVVVRGAWRSAARLPFAGPPDERLLVLPWVGAPTLATAKTPFDGHALGRLWAFDVLIDNSDRLVKGGNPFNILVAGDGSLFALDQRLGPAVTGEVDAAPVTRRRLLSAATAARRRALARALLADFEGEARTVIPRPAGVVRGFERGVADGIRRIAALVPEALDRRLASFGARPFVATHGFAAILRQFREAAASMDSRRTARARA